MTDRRAEFDDLGNTDATRRARYVVADWMVGLPLVLVEALVDLGADSIQAAAAVSDEALLGRPHIRPEKVALLRRHLAALPSELHADAGSGSASTSGPWAIPAATEAPTSAVQPAADRWAAARAAGEAWRSQPIAAITSAPATRPARAADERRLLRILKLREAGLTLDEIGSEFGITGGRVWQIIAETTFDDSPERQQERRARSDREQWFHAIVAVAQQEPTLSLADLLRAHPAPVRLSSEEVVDLLSTHLGAAGFVARRARQVGGRRRTPGQRVQVRAGAVANLKRAAADLGGGPMSYAAYDAWRRDHPGAYSTRNLMRLFGTWRQACQEAGVQPGETNRLSYARGWSEEDCAGHVWQYLIKHSLVGSYHQYESWASHRWSTPSGGTVYNILGGWPEALAAAAEYAIRHGLDTPAVPLDPPRYRLAYASVIERSRPQPGTDGDTPHDGARLDRTSTPSAPRSASRR